MLGLSSLRSLGEKCENLKGISIVTFRNCTTEYCHVKIVPAVSACDQQGWMDLKGVFVQFCVAEEGLCVVSSIHCSADTPITGSGGTCVFQLFSYHKTL